MWRFRTERKRCHFTLSQCMAAILLLSLSLSSCSPPLSSAFCVCVCERACACVSVHTCTQTYGSHVFPYKDWLWEELMRNEQNYSRGTPLFLSLNFFCSLSCTWLQHVSMFKVLLTSIHTFFLFILYFF